MAADPRLESSRSALASLGTVGAALAGAGVVAWPGGSLPWRRKAGLPDPDRARG